MNDSTKSESESEMYLFDPHKKCTQRNSENSLDQGTPIKTSLVANKNKLFYKQNIHNKVIHQHVRISLKSYIITYMELTTCNYYS